MTGRPRHHAGGSAAPQFPLGLRAMLTVGFAIVIGLAILSSAIGWMSHQRAIATVGELVNIHGRIARLSLEANTAMLEARRREKDYLLRFKRLGFEQARAMYVTQVQANVGNMREIIHEIESLSSDEEVIAAVEAIDHAVSEYETTFLAVVSLLEQRGHVDGGLEGQFRAKAHAIEALIVEGSLRTLEVDVLTIRRHEKDYLLRGGVEYVKRVHRAVAHLDAHLAAAAVNADEKERLRTLLNEYGALFDDLVKVDAEIATSIATYRDGVRAIQPLLDGFRADALRAERAALVDMQLATRRSAWTMIGTSLTATLIAFLVALFLSRAIARLYQQILEAMAERTRMEEAARAANLAKSEFLANMSHEIRTPMTAILGFTDVVGQGCQRKCAYGKNHLHAHIHTIRRSGDYLLGLINDILDLSKIEAGKMTVERRNCRPCRIVAEVASLMRVQADAKGLPFNIEYDGAIPETIQSDSTRLRQVLINLIGNATKFTETGGVRLVTRFVGDGDQPALQFDVIDTGRGMTEEEKAKLFQPFMQADNSTTRKFGGTGLGLTISKRFAELLGGDITVVATEMGVGSTFRVTVATGPLEGVKMLDDPMAATVVDSEGAAGFSPRGAAQAQACGSSKLDCRILLAEDGPDNQRLIAFVLKKAGADVTIMENGRLALDTALAARDKGNAFDVILMDMQMPIMDGYEATRQLRREGYTGPIIALTANAMDGDREKCINAGCDDYATKPIDRRKLIATIEAHLQIANV